MVMTMVKDTIIDNILIIEDNDDDFYYTNRDFSENDAADNIYRCINGDEAIEFVKQKGAYTPATAPRPDIILLDLNLPGVDGFAVLQELKNNDKYKKIPIVTLTLYDEGTDVERSIELGADGCITKPVDTAKFYDAVKKLK